MVCQIVIHSVETICVEEFIGGSKQVARRKPLPSQSLWIEESMKIDNMSAINLAKNPIVHGRSKHIEMRFHYLQEQVADGNMNLEHCRTENQIADIMMKGVQVEVFRRLKTMMNIDCLDTMN